jgi:hypothetical protein
VIVGPSKFFVQNNLSRNHIPHDGPSLIVGCHK